MSMKAYGTDLVAATLHMSPKIVQHYVLKCLNTAEVNAHSENFVRPKNSFIMHPHVEFITTAARVRLSKEY